MTKNKSKLWKLTKYRIVRIPMWYLYYRWVALDDASVIAPYGLIPLNKTGHYQWQKRMWLGGKK